MIGWQAIVVGSCGRQDLVVGYQPSSNQASCIPCKDNLKTNSTASTNASDCQGKFMQKRNPEV